MPNVGTEGNLGRFRGQVGTRGKKRSFTFLGRVKKTPKSSERLLLLFPQEQACLSLLHPSQKLLTSSTTPSALSPQPLLQLSLCFLC